MEIEYINDHENAGFGEFFEYRKMRRMVLEAALRDGASTLYFLTGLTSKLGFDLCISLEEKEE